MREIWKRIAADPRYEVSNFGRVRSYCQFAGPHILKAGRASHGYPTVCIGKGKTTCVHDLVATAFIGPKPFPEAEVLHKDGRKQNCRWDNLEWGTRSRNIQDNKWNGSERKLTGADAATIKSQLARGERGIGTHLADSFGVSQSLISAIRHGKVHVDA